MRVCAYRKMSRSWASTISPRPEFYTPSLTTIRQPLREMGNVAASLLLQKMAGKKAVGVSHVNPQLVVGESTGRARQKGKTLIEEER